MNKNEVVKENIKRLMEQREMSKVMLIEKSGIAKQTLYRVFKLGKGLQYRTLKKIAKVLAVTAEDLMTGLPPKIEMKTEPLKVYNTVHASKVKAKGIYRGAVIIDDENCPNDEEVKEQLDDKTNEQSNWMVEYFKYMTNLADKYQKLNNRDRKIVDAILGGA